MSRFNFQFSNFRYKYFFFLLAGIILSCTSFSQIVRNNYSLNAIDSSLKDDSLMKSEILPYKIKADKIMNEVLAYSDQVLKGNQPEGLLGDFMSDLILKSAKEHCADTCSVDICILNNGGMRNPLPKGNITRDNIFQFMPYENEMVVLFIKGSDVSDILNFIANKGGIPVAGLRMKIKYQMPSDVMIGDKPFDENKTYTIVTSDYLANGGDNMTFFLKATKKINLGIKLRDAIINYLQDETKKGNSINVKTDGRIQIVK
jgi:2',3'-cyclic-nucleotide 2'-phosphodiesterase (5'-nucleotidase family)